LLPVKRLSRLAGRQHIGVGLLGPFSIVVTADTYTSVLPGTTTTPMPLHATRQP
jgi:hypothetical protein